MKISSEEFQGKVLKGLDPQAQDVVRKVALAGNMMLFNEKTHQQIFDDMLSGGGELADNLGNGVANIMLLIYGKSKSMPRGALPLAGAILLANTAEVLDKSDTPVDEATFDDAMQTMIVKIFDRFDPEFRNKVSQKTGKQVPQRQQRQQQSPQGMQQTGGMPQGRGLISQAGM